MYLEGAAVKMADRAASLAQFEVERLKAFIEVTRGRQGLVQKYAERALELATEAGDKERLVQANYLLAMSTGNLGYLDEARQYAEEVMSHNELTGNRVQMESMRAELAGFYINVGRYEEAIPLAEKAYRFFSKIKHEPWLGYLSSNLAEAYFETGNMERAEQMPYTHEVQKTNGCSRMPTSP